MDINQIIDQITENLEKNLDTSTDELENLLKNGLKSYLMDVKDPALDLGKKYLTALFLSEAAPLLDLDKDLTDEELIALSNEASIRRETLMAALAAQMGVVAQAEAEKQASCAELREKTLSFLTDLLKKAGQIGVGIITSSIVGL